jgi:hypothetical protein
MRPGLHWACRKASLRYAGSEGNLVVWSEEGTYRTYRSERAFMVATANLTLMVVDPSTGQLFLQGGQFLFLEDDDASLRRVDLPTLTAEWFADEDLGFSGANGLYDSSPEFVYESWHTAASLKGTQVMVTVCRGGPHCQFFARREVGDGEWELLDGTMIRLDPEKKAPPGLVWKHPDLALPPT